MFVSYKWLSEYVDLDISPEELAEKITKSGIEVENVQAVNEGIKDVVVGQVLEKEQHPNAEKLSKCLVDIGEGEPVQIICGAQNVEKGQKVPVAKVGAVLPGNFKIKRAKLRGEESNGMICSLQELGIEGKLVPKEFSDGIFVFPSDAEVGKNAMEQLFMDDYVLELGLTPNRSDCLSMIGVAYEVAAILKKEVRKPEVHYEAAEEKATDYITVNVEAKEDNPFYVAKIIKNVKIAPSPLWMQMRLIKAGIRPHNNVVDITNYCLLEYGQPLHAFDYDRFGSKEILVRRAHDGETIVTLDDQERKLTSDHLVITNGKVPVALAGVMGGADSEVRDDTTTVLLEAAYFKGSVVRKASKDFGLRSEASLRFEKGVDPNRVKAAAERAAQLIAKYASGTVLEGEAEFHDFSIEKKVITISAEKINNVLGTNIAVDEIKEIFDRLQFETVEENGLFTVTVPTRRGDIAIEEDLIEEVARLYGYDYIPSTLPEGSSTSGALTDYQLKRRKVRRFLEGAGLYQAITYSLTSKEKAGQFTLETSSFTQLALPMSEERSVLRLSLLPHLLESVKYNKARQIDDIHLYEIGSVFISDDALEKPLEKERLSGVMTGHYVYHPWQGEKTKVDFYVVKGILDGLFDLLGLLDEIEYKQAKREGLHPGRTADIYLNGSFIGFVGELNPEVEKEYDLDETYVFELKLADLIQYEAKPVIYTPIPRFPSITRDIALVVDQHVHAGELQETIREAGGKLLKEISIFDVYEGERLGAGKKSIAFSLRYYDPERTLTDEEAAKAHEKVIKAVEEKFSAVLRS
ncbi:phenylalanine--tRNA ligase subunit beta [Bacillaceae bacterium ZC4]|uniref:phenylalanine--tRNA ligase subunit beta n=1 Tax=Aeribacillus TaxID=1055323 RepID=UPI0010239E77|nr:MULTISPECIES: phenylalanine--tRNA ligase subunit beta [Aeribacillus]AXI40292.1 phenylalanine--tRNA ligase subunit beta [Bacillaceae bacterium ZC4]AXI40349.1 phenylalanine--tRNA ligase subunit beta [Bacillaceae bacterium ZC4]MED1437180.1 phenylalanine--tRNA ligase subunit beta [Aeribacillus composti]RZI53251.1 phenylalanine--tRNA ligase subunit beta [Aeribacillus pallidus]